MVLGRNGGTNPSCRSFDPPRESGLVVQFTFDIELRRHRDRTIKGLDRRVVKIALGFLAGFAAETFGPVFLAFEIGGVINRNHLARSRRSRIRLNNPIL